MNTTSVLTAAIQVVGDHTDPSALRLKLRITNPMDRPIEILNPDLGVPSPAMNWTFTEDAYRTALLLSFGYLAMSVSDESGHDLPRQPIMTSATPALRPAIKLEPGDSLVVEIPVGSFYRLEPKQTYRVVLEYGDQNLKVLAHGRVTVP